MAISSSVPPNPAEYAGDEVQALVLDSGYSSVRAGFAGEDTPKSICPSYYGLYNGRKIFGDHVIDLPRENISIQNPMSKDGVVEDWETAEALWKYSFVSKLTGPRPNKALQQWLNDPGSVPNLTEAMKEGEEIEKCLEDHPLFMTECGWNSAKAREKTTEIAMESWGAPAFYLGRSGVMAAFSAGKASALVIDIGASVASVTPIHDGIILQKGVTRSHLGGNFVSSQIRAMLASNNPPITITPHYLLVSKTAVDAGQPAQAVYKEFPKGFTPPQESFRRYQEERVLLEFKESAVQTWPGPQPLMSTSGGVSQLDLAESYPGRTFEFPDGYNQLFTANRYRVAESLFDPRAAYPDAEIAAPTAEQTIPALAKQALSQVDVDIRPHLLSNVVVVGGTSLLYGFTERLKVELEKLSPSTRVRIHAPGNTVERRFGSWIGGSIMASLGTFHQMWISKKEYDEHGPSIVEKRCK